MNKQEFQLHYSHMNEWFRSLDGKKDEKWLEPLAEGKWSQAAVVAHLLFWDQYSLEERFPHIREGVTLERFPDFQSVNDRAEEYAHNGIEKADLIKELLEVRKKIEFYLDSLTEEDLRTAFHIGEHPLTLGEYFEDFASHDLHHKKQLVESMK
jgi:uncharacterized damage-inducible protein DinB